MSSQSRSYLISNESISIENQHNKWKKIEHCWIEFIQNNQDPRNMPDIRQEISESWIRSQKNGIDPYAKKFEASLDPEKFQILLKEKSLLINTALPFLKKVEQLVFPISNGFLINLFDENGVLLYMSGDETILNHQAEYNIVPGLQFSEETAGTHSASCLVTQAPLQVTGPEHYCNLLWDCTASAAPIFYPDKSLAGAIAISSFDNKCYDKNHPHTLGMVASIAWAIQNQLRLEIRNQELSMSRGILQATLAATEEGFVTLDANGMIVQANQAACNLLNLDFAKIIGSHFESILGKQPEINKVLADGKAIHDFEAYMINERARRNCLVSVQPILDRLKDTLNGVVVNMHPIEKINKLIAFRSGSEAQFTFENIIGNSFKLKSVMEKAQTASKNPLINVFISGESGTGKELFAQAIHNKSRPQGPFVALNCSALPRSLVESELFGYESGAFTGAEKKGRPGKIELANGGTLFLDEIGDMPIEIQPILLRVLENKKVMRIGGNRYIPVDFRIIAATNQDLLKLVREKKFREDLYFRLSVFKLSIPPLRERENDGELLAKYFINVHSSKMNTPPAKLTPEASRIIRNYQWPGNVRQLENAMIYALSIAQDQWIGKTELPEDILGGSEDEGLPDLMKIKDLEKRAIKKALSSTNNNTLKAANILGIGRTTLYRKLKDYGIEVKDSGIGDSEPF